MNLIDQFSNFFQQYFQIIVNDQIYRTGKLILLNHKEFYLKLIYIDKKHNKQRTVEIPLPYNFLIKNNEIILDYTNDTFCNKNEDLFLNIKKINTNYNHHPFYNKKILLKFSNIDF